jgi:hypothetical protein
VDSGRTNWDEIDENSVLGVFDHPNMSAGASTSPPTLADMATVCASMAACAGALPLAQMAFMADSAPALPLTTFAVFRHALHDALHHVLDVRGIASMEPRAAG